MIINEVLLRLSRSVDYSIQYSSIALCQLVTVTEQRIMFRYVVPSRARAHRKRKARSRLNCSVELCRVLFWCDLCLVPKEQVQIGRRR